MSRGKYIVLEGPEGVGKTTQILELARRLQAAGLPVRTLREPDSQSDLTARALRQLTQDPRYPMNTNTEVLLYNAARSQSLQVIKNSVDQGVICIVDRNYLTTLAIQYYGRGDVPDYETINKIIAFAVNGVEPDLCIVLDAPVQTLKARLGDRVQGERFDNLDDAFLERVRAGYLWEAKQRDLPVVFATDDSETVANNIWKLVADSLAVRDISSASVSEPVSLKQIISEKQQATAKVSTDANKIGDYFTPKNLSPKLAVEYQQWVDTILAKQAELSQALTAKSSSTTAAQLILPVAAANAKPLIAQNNADDSLATIAKKDLQETHDEQTSQRLNLVDYWPRVELTLVPSILYKYSNSTARQLADQLDDWSYEQKASVLSTYIAENTDKALADIGYTWEIMAPYSTLQALQSQEGVSVELQQLTPRYGYDVPKEVEEAGVADLFEDCFDASLAFYSKLQAADHTAEAQYVTLAGHVQRFKITLNASTLLRLQSDIPVLRTLLEDMNAKIAEVQPLIAAALQAK